MPPKAKKAAPEPTPASSDSDVQDLLECSQAKYGSGSAVVLSHPGAISSVKQWCPTGSTTLDLAIGGGRRSDGVAVPGGIPYGRVVEVRGETSEGKSLLLSSIMAQNQRAGGVSVLFDTEDAHDPAHDRDIGVDTDNLVIPQPEDDGGVSAWTVEAVMERIEFYVRRWITRKNTRPLLIGWDSVAGTPSRYEMNQEPGDENYGKLKVGGHATVMGSAMRKLTQLISSVETASLVCVNQLRSGPPPYPGAPAPKFSLGGRALPFHASVRLEVRWATDIYTGSGDDKRLIGMVCEAETIKSRVACPFQKARYAVYFKTGICDHAMLPDALARAGLIPRPDKTGYYEVPLADGTTKRMQQAAWVVHGTQHPEDARHVANLLRDGYGR